MTGPVVVFCMPERGHFQRLRSLIAALGARRVATHVFTHREYRDEVERSGATFVDLFGRFPLATADAESQPFACRYVSYAAHFADPIRREVELLRPRLIVHDGFAVIGRLVASSLGLPRVNVCAGHNVAPEPFLERLRRDPRVRLSERCHHAVEILRQRHGWLDASPFSYVTALSPDLNLYCEPPDFLTADERRVFEPVEFWGSLPPHEELAARRPASPSFGAGADGNRKIYVSFGTVVWRYYAEEALRALTTIVETVGDDARTRLLISLGRHPLEPQARAALSHASTTIESYVDQWRVLEEADLFVTHHGLNSTHEAIFHAVPMVSYPFFWDQPALAAKCQERGLAVPLVSAPRAGITAGDVEDAIATAARRGDAMRLALSEAGRRERDVVAARPAVLERVLALAASA